MNTTELIEIARECGALGFNTLEFTQAGLRQFAQRIEQPLLDRIVELANTANANLNAKDKQIEQLREALQDANKHIEGLHGEFVLLREGLRQARFVAKEFIDSYEDLASSVGVFEAEKESIKRARRQLKALEWK